MTLSELRKLKKSLPKGATAELASIYGLSRKYINSILRGDRRNGDVLHSAVLMAEKELERKKSIQQRIKML